ncbi:hypothetical protein ACWT_0145 [Actinoplanes sp. SE50]|uniref:hypothetical protein n=1 Tax=unclassified Actinoplanes TaxID=2626549 RepID=UPI00023ED521|nr:MULTISPECIES: hypothetical protein [unclassified Actinoplanes]AEV81159.1 hypothetical protein ACPL_260 [Actinoplanes sp. SE50/110]ATO79560.1 hypothetical protein ACWT_0145 [Actinoplanes sp. SE50]SLL96961.1 hypothetical protein ACSP50_0156 [Actinoplanes sp. SE50/110]
MRRTIATLTAVAGLSLALTGCTRKPDVVSGEAAPIGGIVSATTTPPPAAAGSPTTTTPTTKPAVRVVSTGNTDPAPAKRLILGPDGLSALKIGMTAQDALATGMIVGYHASTACTTSHLKGHDDAVVQHSPGKGIIAISAYGDIRTPEGIHLGSTLEEVMKAYGKRFKPSEVDGTVQSRTGRAWATSTDLVNYRFFVKKDKVVELEVEHAHQDCYE